MLRLLAIAFPALVLFATLALLRPGRVLERPARPRVPSTPGWAPSPLAYQATLQGTYVALTFALTPLLAVCHHALLVAAGEEPGGYAHRLSDEWPIAFLVALFVAMCVAFACTVRLLHAWLADRFTALLDDAGIGKHAPTLRRQVDGTSRTFAVVGLLAVLFVAATFENALVVRDGTFRFRPLFGAAAERRVEEIRCLFIRKGWGRSPNRRFLELELWDGTEIHPGNALEGSAIEPAIAALQAQAPRRIPVVH